MESIKSDHCTTGQIVYHASHQSSVSMRDIVEWLINLIQKQGPESIHTVEF